MSSIDPKLTGWWQLKSLEMPEGKALQLIGGRPGDRVCFSEAGHYCIYPRIDDGQHYRCRPADSFSELDIWIEGLKALTSFCIYTIDADVLKVTVAGRGAGSEAIERPSAMRLDRKRNWVVITMERCKPPKKRVIAQSDPTIEFGPLKDFLAGKGKATKGKAKNWLGLCTLEVTTGSLWTGDPHLANADDGCVVKVPRGQYVIEGIGFTSERNRSVHTLRVRLESVKNPVLGEKLGENGTDSAMIGVCDICAFEKACSRYSGDEIQVAIESQTGDGVGIISISKSRGGMMPFVPTGSDGIGPVIALMSDGKCVGVELPFMKEDR